MQRAATTATTAATVAATAAVANSSALVSMISVAALLWLFDGVGAAAAATDGIGTVTATASALPPPLLHLIVPCYNEADRLPSATFEAYAAAHPDIQFTFVNDGSTDDTLQILRALAARRPAQLHVLDLDRNRGKAEATRLGMVSVLDTTLDRDDGLLVGFWDGDLVW